MPVIRDFLDSDPDSPRTSPVSGDIEEDGFFTDANGGYKLGMIAACAIVAVFIGVFILFLVRRYRHSKPRQCLVCQQNERRLIKNTYWGLGGGEWECKPCFDKAANEVITQGGGSQGFVTR